MARKKILFVIVEGPSDEQALGLMLSRIFNNSEVYVHILHCDITTQNGVTTANIISKIGGIVTDSVFSRVKVFICKNCCRIW